MTIKAHHHHHQHQNHCGGEGESNLLKKIENQVEKLEQEVEALAHQLGLDGSGGCFDGGSNTGIVPPGRTGDGSNTGIVPPGRTGGGVSGSGDSCGGSQKPPSTWPPVSQPPSTWPPLPKPPTASDPAYAAKIHALADFSLEDEMENQEARLFTAQHTGDFATVADARNKLQMIKSDHLRRQALIGDDSIGVYRAQMMYYGDDALRDEYRTQQAKLWKANVMGDPAGAQYAKERLAILSKEMYSRTAIPNWNSSFDSGF